MRVLSSASRGLRLGLFALIAAACVALDQWAKAAALENLVPGRPVPLVPGVMDLLLVRNTGAAFSFGEGAGWLFVLVCVAVVVALVAYLWRATEVPMALVVCAGLVAGGGVGNLIDRVSRGWVCDFFATTFMDFAVFNVADIFVCVGVALGLLFLFLWEREEERREEERSKAAASGVSRSVSEQEHKAQLEQGRGRLTSRKKGGR